MYNIYISPLVHHMKLHPKNIVTFFFPSKSCRSKKTTPKAMEISRQEEEFGSQGFFFESSRRWWSHGTVGGGISIQDEGGFKRNGTNFGGIKQAANVLKVQFLSIFQGVGQGLLNYSSNICKSMII